MVACHGRPWASYPRGLGESTIAAWLALTESQRKEKKIYRYTVSRGLHTCSLPYMIRVTNPSWHFSTRIYSIGSVVYVGLIAITFYLPTYLPTCFCLACFHWHQWLFGIKRNSRSKNLEALRCESVGLRLSNVTVRLRSQGFWWISIRVFLVHKVRWCQKLWRIAIALQCSLEPFNSLNDTILWSPSTSRNIQFPLAISMEVETW